MNKKIFGGILHNGNVLKIVGAKGNNGSEIASIEPMVISEKSNGENIYKVTLTNGKAFAFSTRNGDKGEPGDSAIFDSATGNISTMLQTTGDNTLSPMSQDAITRALNEVDQKIINQMFVTQSQYDTLMENNMIDSATLYNIYE